MVIRYGDQGGVCGAPIAADILDYKTDAVHDAAHLDELVEHYRPQLDAYRDGLSQMLRLDASRIRCRLLMLATGEVK